jgi:hypothetical protein
MPESELLTFRTLYDSPMISVRDYICRDTSHDHSAEEMSDANGIVLMRHGAFSRHFGKKVTTAILVTRVFTKNFSHRSLHIPLHFLLKNLLKFGLETYRL